MTNYEVGCDCEYNFVKAVDMTREELISYVGYLNSRMQEERKAYVDLAKEFEAIYNGGRVCK